MSDKSNITIILENSSESADVINLYSIYKRRRYELSINLNEHTKYQKPNAILNRDGFICIINDNLEKTNKQFNEEKKIIEMIINITDKFYIELILSESNKFVYPLEQRVFELEELVADLKTCIDFNKPEILHEIEYPRWDSLDEFKKLPEFQYIEMAYDYDRYIKRINDKMCLEYKQNSLQEPCYVSLFKNSDSNSKCMGFFNTFRNIGGESSYDDIISYRYLSNTDKRLCASEKIDQNKPYEAFGRSLKVCDYTKIYRIHERICRFFGNYFFGWIIGNLGKVYEYNFNFKIIASGNKAKCRLLLCKNSPNPLLVKLSNTTRTIEYYEYKKLSDVYVSHSINGCTNLTL